jgi:predicted HicB family RNase H-like nuclease
MNTLEYKGYTGTMEVDTDAKVIFGRVTNIRTVTTFEGETIVEAEQAFRDLAMTIWRVRHNVSRRGVVRVARR